MATREGAIRITLRDGTFRTQMRRTTSMISDEGKKMQWALSNPVKAGLSSIKASISNTFNEFKSNIKSVLSFGGLLGGGALVSDLMTNEVAFLQLSAALSKFSKENVTAAEVQEMLGRVADDTKIPLGDLIDTLSQLTSASGKVDIEKLLERAASQARRLGIEGQFVARSYTRLVAKGIASSAEEAENLVEQFSDLFRKMLGVDLDEAIEPNDIAELAGFANTTGNSFAQMLRLISLGGEKISKDFGKANEIVEKMGLSLHQSKGIDEMTEKLKIKKGILDANKSALENMLAIADLGPKKFKAMTDALAGDIAGQALKEIVGEKVIVDAIAGKVTKDEWNLRVEKLRRELSSLDDLMVDRQKLEEEDNKFKKTAAANFNDAMNKIRNAFSQKEMIEAVDTLSEKLPIMAKGVADLITLVMNNPWKALAVGSGAKILGSFIHGALHRAASDAFGKLKDTVQDKLTERMLKRMEQRATGDLRYAPYAWGGGAISGHDMRKQARAQKISNFLGAASVAALAGSLGYAVGTAIHENLLDPMNKAYNKKVQEAERTTTLGVVATSRTSTIKEKLEAIEKIKRTRAGLGEGVLTTENLAGTIAGFFSDKESPLERLERIHSELWQAQAQITRSLIEQVNAQNESTSGVEKFTREINQAGDTIRQAFPSSGGASRGVLHLPLKPGAEPTRG